ncbi:methyltransferase domain-containing protein [Paenibacillus kobensis]|uniref:hypothetical protein n=1 Tax=Paenibacillus kobensis TaxID=59841 RepID=UPI000FD8D157|nr:hypothetical protein [Paenibacillus kobensis]
MTNRLDAYETFLAGAKKDAIIDLGCGYGGDTLYLTERGYRYSKPKRCWEPAAVKVHFSP